MPESSKPRVPTIHKIGELFAVFTTAKPSWKLQDLARQLEWDAATTHRFLKALVDIRMLDYDDESAVYSVGLLPLELAGISDSASPRRRELLAQIAQIGEESELTTQIGVQENDVVAIVASHESSAALRAAAMLGERLPLHASAAGKAILTQITDEEIEALLPRTLESFTSRTITDRAELIEQVQKGREDGTTFVEGELSDGLYALAIPVPRNHFSSQLAGVTCAGISREIAPAKWEIAETALRELAATFPENPLTPTT